MAGFKWNLYFSLNRYNKEPPTQALENFYTTKARGYRAFALIRYSHCSQERVLMQYY